VFTYPTFISPTSIALSSNQYPNPVPKKYKKSAKKVILVLLILLFLLSFDLLFPT